MERTRRQGLVVESIRNLLRVLTIEPMLFVRSISYSAPLATIESFKLQRFCRVNLNYSADLCEKMDDGHHTDLQVEVQKLVNVFNFYDNLLGSIIPVVMILFIASWSDQRGRKWLMVLSLFGYTLYMGTYLLASIFTSWPAEVLYVGSFSLSLGGGIVLFYMAVYSYIVDHSQTESRTARLTIMRVFWQLGNPAGTAIGALIYGAAGYSWVFALSVALYILCLIYCVVLVKDNEKPKGVDQGVSKQRSIYNPKNVVDLVRTCFRKREGRGSLHILILVVIMLMVFGTFPHNLYLWTLRVLNWNMNSYSLYMTVNQVCQTISMLCLTPLLTCLRPHDCSLGSITGTLLFIKFLTLGLVTEASQSWVLYLFVIIPTDFATISIRSLLSKVCTNDNISKKESVLLEIEKCSMTNRE
ncbi:lysosomal proton-coupled steroid conjugate and bile acid symporter SLC46A3-like [Macrobrachium nipponense]|uniref:lysosomal proton-coupled steroid conjugate and bile acid symporter SLC46A3-like n=1 Tax=Macrobrachium nipponense TaxID=159736 RepID=UPI0030C8A128